MRRDDHSRDRWILAIGVFKFVKAALLIAVAIGLVRLLVHGSVADEVERWARRLNLDARNPFFQALPGKVERMSPRKLSMLDAGVFVYAGLFLLEGTGLVLRKRWGEYCTIFITGSFLPFEIYELVAKEFSPFKLTVLLVNVAIVIYLIWHLRRGRNFHASEVQRPTSK